MANSFRAAFAVCPYFLGEKRKSITCEDVYRIFNSLNAKHAWMDMFCDSEWEECPYAKKLNAAYERFDKGDDMALKENEIDSLRKEMKGVSSRLGRVEKELRKKTQECLDWEVRSKLFYEKSRKATEELEDYQKHEAERYIAMAMLYEDRLAYLIDTFCNGKLEEKDVKAWAEGKEYALTFDKESKEPIWIVEMREEQDEQLLDKETKE